jgi:iron complex outermembrane receptor protein
MRFRQLGMVRHRGVEVSIAGQVAPGLNLVAGNVLIDAKVSGEEVNNHVIGPRPVGTFRRHTIIVADYRLPNSPLSFDAFAEGTSQRVANSANSLFVPTRAVLNLGSRYRFKVGKADVLARAQIGNVFNTFGWAIGSSGFYFPNGARRWSVALAADI